MLEGCRNGVPKMRERRAGEIHCYNNILKLVKQLICSSSLSSSLFLFFFLLLIQFKRPTTFGTSTHLDFYMNLILFLPYTSLDQQNLCIFMCICVLKNFLICYLYMCIDVSYTSYKMRGTHVGKGGAQACVFAHEKVAKV